MHKPTYSNTTTQAEIQEYPIAVFWRYFLYLVLIGAIVLFSWLGYYVLTDPQSDMPAYIMVPVVLLLIFGSVYLLVRAHNEKLLVEPDRFVHIKAYDSSTIYFLDVKGFTIDENYISIIPIALDTKKIRLTTYISHAHDLERYLAENFANLDDEEYQTQLSEILTDNSLGFTGEEREQKLKQAKLWCNLVNWPSLIVAGMLIFHPTPYLILMTVGIVYPLLAIAVLKSNSLIRFDEENNSPHPSIGLGFFMPFLGVVARLVWDMSISNFQNLWLPSVGFFAVLLLILFAGHSEFSFSSGKKIAIAMLALVFVYFYCLVAVVTVNCVYDGANSKDYVVKITGKNVTNGRNTSYHLALEKWGTQKEGGEESVSSELYQRTQIGETVIVSSRQGLLGAPWYTVH